MATRFGVDVGGTFTDLLFYDDVSGAIVVAKVPTTPAAPELGVLTATEAGIPTGLVGSTEFFLHGTTVGLNALLERRGATVGLLSTKGFRDTLAIRRGDKSDPYSLTWRPQPPLVPRHLRLEITERIKADGSVHSPFEAADVAAAAAYFNEHSVDAVAVSFMNSYVNPAHELLAEEALRDAGYLGGVSLSHRVSGEYREYERTSTVVIDAFVRGRMASYFARLDTELRTRGFTGTSLITRCGGGSLTFEQAEERPFETINSGPVAGAEGAAEVARRRNIKHVVTADVGGTSFDTCLISDGRPALLFQGLVADMPVQTPWVDVRSIGAGGGSIATVDVGGLLRVGPRSAGAVPGPASYGRGGTEPTTTDAAFVLGMLGHGKLSSGLELDRAAALDALSPLAERLGLDSIQVARGIMTIAAASMASAVRSVTIDQGTDPRTATLMPFGGAGPLFATLLADELGLDDVLVPPYAGNFSAWGLLGADLTRTAAKTLIRPLEAASLEDVNRVASDLLDAMKRSDIAGEVQHDVTVDMRYRGQDHSITVDLDWQGSIGLSVDAVERRFLDLYERRFDHTMDEVIQIAAVRVAARQALPTRKADAIDDSTGETHEPIRAWSFNRAGWMEFAVVDRNRLTAESRPGPMIVVEPTATTYVDAAYSVRIDGDRSMLIERNRTEVNP